MNVQVYSTGVPNKVGGACLHYNYISAYKKISVMMHKKITFWHLTLNEDFVRARVQAVQEHDALGYLNLSIHRFLIITRTF